MRAIITGAASGIGRATAKKLLEDCRRRDGTSVDLLLVDVNADALTAVLDEVRALGGTAHGFVGDLSDPAVPQAAIDEGRKTLGGLDALISNAGIISRASLLELTLEDYEKSFAVNTRATWLLAKAAYPMLAEAHGCIVATSSIAGHAPTPALGAYSMSKAALLMLVRQIACDWGPVGIRCNSVSPGSTETGISRNSGAPVGSEKREGRNPLRMIAQPEDQAAVISFLAGPEARFVTGADLLVDGGASTQLMVASGMGNPWNRPQATT